MASDLNLMTLIMVPVIAFLANSEKMPQIKNASESTKSTMQKMLENHRKIHLNSWMTKS